MEYLNKRYDEAQNKLWNAGQQLEQMKGDLWLTSDDKANRRQHIANDLNKEVEAATEEIYNRAIDDLAEAHNDFHDSLKGNAKDKQGRAAIMGPAYAAMSNDELLRILDAKFDDNTERGLLLDYLEARATGKEKEKGLPGLAAVEDPLQSKIKEITTKNLDRLHGWPARRLQRYNEAQDGHKFAINAETALRTELLKHNEQLVSIDMFKRKEARGNIELLKQKYKLTTQSTGTQSGALMPDYGHSKRGTQRGR